MEYSVAQPTTLQIPRSGSPLTEKVALVDPLYSLKPIEGHSPIHARPVQGKLANRR